MKRALFIFTILVAAALAATVAADDTGILGGFRGSFIRVVAGYTALLGLTHAVYLLLPKFRIGQDGRID